VVLLVKERLILVLDLGARRFMRAEGKVVRFPTERVEARSPLRRVRGRRARAPLKDSRTPNGPAATWLPGPRSFGVRRRGAGPT